MKRKAIKAAIIVVVAVAVLAGLNALVQRPGAGEALGSGLIEADEYQVSSKLPGRVAEVLAREGDEVRAGQPVARLEHEDVDAEVARAEGAVQAADAAVREMRRGSRAEIIQAGQARLAQAQAAREGAQRQLATTEEAYGKVTDLKAGQDAAAARVRLAEANVAAAQAKLEEARRGPTEPEIETARATVRVAEARLASASNARQDAQEIYDRQMAIETPVIVASTEQAALGAQTRLTEQELARAQAMAAEEAASEQTVQRAEAAHAGSRARLTGAERGTADAQQQVAMARATAKQKLDAARDAVVEAQRAREVAQAQLEVLLAGTRVERVRQAEAALAAVTAEAAAARTALGHATESFQDRLAARAQRDTAEASYKSAQALEKAARAELDLLRAGQTVEAIELAEGRLTEARAALQAAQVKRGYCEIVAPVAGTITEVVAKVGEMAPAGGAVVVLTDLNNLYLRAYLGFTTLGRVTQGQELKVRTEAAPGRVFRGRVIRVSEQAEFTPKDVQTADQRIKQVYWVKVDLGDGERVLKPGMPADLLP